jgi:pimeloyl-ACP methyl ester carboxylesterase
MEQLIMGLAGMMTSWQRQTRYFGHDHGDKYSVLILDNRGVGNSDKLLARYSTSEMAADIVELLDHVGWRGQREVHAVGISLGGMIAQELACAIPSRLASLSLLCTTSLFQNTFTIRETLEEYLSFVVPKTMEQGIVDTARKIFTDEFLLAADDSPLPSPKTTPRCGPAPTSDGEYGHFDCNFQRFQAQELTKRLHPTHFTKQGFLCQLVAAGWHRKTPEQLRAMADAVGRERILIMHGTADKMIKLPNGERLIEAVQPGTGLIIEGMGHAPVMERTRWFNELLETKVAEWAKLGSGD